MATKVWIDGEIHATEQAKISVFDRGFLYGDSVFESLRTWRGIPLFLDEHLARLSESCAGVGITPPSSATIARAVSDTLAAAVTGDAAHGDSMVRIIVSRGEGEMGLDPALADGHGPRLIVIVRAIALPAVELYSTGAVLAILARQRVPGVTLDPKIKSSNYLSSILAIAEAKKAGAYEAVLLDGSGKITEGTTSNVFYVERGVLKTPEIDAGILVGITRHHVLAVAREANIPFEETRPGPEALEHADEIFITSSIRGVVPMTRIVWPKPVDGQPSGAVRQHAVGTGLVGPITQTLMEGYSDLCEREASHRVKSLGTA